MTGTQSIAHFGTFNSNGGLHIGRYLQISDELGVAPEVELVAPADGATLFEGQAVCIEADASDDIGVARVDFFANGVKIGSDNLAPYLTIWSPTRPPPTPRYPNGHRDRCHRSLLRVLPSRGRPQRAEATASP